MKAGRQSLDDISLLDAGADAWLAIEEQTITLVPSPIGLTEAVSPYMSKSSGHGKVRKLGARMIHNGSTLSIRLSWPDPDKDDELGDLDQFTDGVAVMFPLKPGASAFSMGSSDRPVNAWFWKADEKEPFDVFASGYATSQRRLADDSGLKAASRYEKGGWTVVFQRPLQAAGENFVSIEPGSELAIAFAVWEGSNKERSAQKSVSGEFTELSVEA